MQRRASAPARRQCCRRRSRWRDGAAVQRSPAYSGRGDTRRRKSRGWPAAPWVYRRRFTHAAFHVVDQVVEVVGQRLDAGFAADAQRAAVFMRIRHELHFRHHAVDRRLRRQVAGDRQRAVGHAVVAAGEADHAGTAGVFFRQLQRGFHRIGAGRAAELQAIPFAFARQQREQVIGETIFQRGREIESM